MIKYYRYGRQGPSVLFQALLVKHGLIIKKLAKKLSIVVGFMLQQEEDFKLDFGLVFEGYGEDKVGSFVGKAVFFIFKLFEVKGVELLF